MAKSRRGREIKFEWHIDAVGGDEGKALAETQARAVRDLLQWVARNRQEQMAGRTEAGSEVDSELGR